MTASPTELDAIRSRLLSVSKINGWSVMVVAALSILMSLGDLSGMLLGAMVLASPYMELTGHYGLKRGERTAGRWLPRSQWWLLAIIVLYCLFQLLGNDSAGMLSELAPDERSAVVAFLGGEAQANELIGTATRLTYALLLVVSVLYQGGLSLYYQRRIQLLGKR